jgi:hypothetical protein
MKELKPKVGAKTRFNSHLYIFEADVNGKHYFKVGNTSDWNTYHSKNRFCPMVEWRGVLQVHNHGTLLERLIGKFLRGRFKNTEWFVGDNCEQDINALVAAIVSNGRFQKENATRMTFIADFRHSFTGIYRTSIDDYLSLFRVRNAEGKLFKLTGENLTFTVARIMSEKFFDEQATAAASPPPNKLVVETTTKK